MAKKKYEKVEAEDKKSKVIDLDSIRKKFDTDLASNEDFLPETHPRIPSRCITFNYHIGGGIPYGTIMEIYGEESTGKTLIALDFAAVTTTSLGGWVLWDDAERCFDKTWAIENGVDVSKVIVFRNSGIEKMADWLHDCVTWLRGSVLLNNEPILFVCDSIAALDLDEKLNIKFADRKAEMGNRAKALGDMLRTKNEFLSDAGVCSIFINQLRSKIGAGLFEDPDTTPGGQAMKFFASIRIGIYQAAVNKQKLGGHEVPVGKFNNVRIKKNKTAPPKPNFKISIIFDKDFDNVGIEKYYGLDYVCDILEVVERTGGTHRIEGEIVARSKDEFVELLGSDKDLRKKVLALIPVNTISKTKELLAEIPGNQYDITKYLK